MHRMTSTQARHTRRAVLQAAVDAGAECATVGTDLFFREDGEPYIEWQARRAEAVRVCVGCPARAACTELALRDGDGQPTRDDMVRAGLTGPELAALRGRQAVRLAAATAADRDTEGQELDRLVAELRAEAITSPDSARYGTVRSTALRTAAQTDRLRTLAAQIRQIRTARRTRTGWGVAA
ncbi:WhiB family transcriptional regulator [Streptomyces sp. AM 2-1-1]|uniref:WhiB family transcriptional regulator n=1 Tax=Streptomyces sp. AM 2-1-1 TaxID=3028709 RepID=UPI0023B95AB7|nr:WhiB family transcriptional regulator [Streptomyces sp. AM 2-1-1]WEH43984.1 WhiB family transcriptional regulator [Streptomyces sp. AM 2-1-1]